MKFFVVIIAVAFTFSQVWGAQGSINGDTWETIGTPQITGKNTKTIWVEYRFKLNPEYYNRSLEEANCMKEETRTLKYNTYTKNGTLVKSTKPKNVKPYYGYAPPIPGTPSQGMFDVICGKH